MEAMRRRSRGCGGEPTPAGRAEALRQKVEEVRAVLAQSEVPSTPTLRGGAVLEGPDSRLVVRLPEKQELVVVIGTSQDIEVPGLIQRICDVVDRSYTAVGKHKRMDYHDAVDRLEMGDAGLRANRVLHLVFKGDECIGCASSTFSPGWTPPNCGHWGLLAVDPAHQSSGAGTALVLAAERRLSTVSEMIQIEYRMCGGEEFSERLYEWYEGRLGFDGGPKPPRGSQSFRRCYKRISEEDQAFGQRRRLEAVEAWLVEQLAQAELAAAEASAEKAASSGPDEEAVVVSA